MKDHLRGRSGDFRRGVLGHRLAPLEAVAELPQRGGGRGRLRLERVHGRRGSLESDSKNPPQTRAKAQASRLSRVKRNEPSQTRAHSPARTHRF